jgi:hypothetical protein
MPQPQSWTDSEDDLPTIEDANVCPDCGEPGEHDRCNLMQGNRFRAMVEHVEEHDRHNAIMALVEGLAGFCR